MNDQIKSSLWDIINEYEIKSKSYKVSHFLWIKDYNDLEFDKWRKKVKVLLFTGLKTHPLTSEMLQKFVSCMSIEGYDRFVAELKGIYEELDLALDTTLLANRVNILLDDRKSVSGKKSVFISHSDLDKEYVKAFVELLECIGVVGNEKIFCSSLAEYGIPTGESIYAFLKEKINEDIHFIAILSDNYYKSVACMNEMGAAWVTSKKQTALLMPEFNFEKIDGAIDASKMWFKLTDEPRINTFKKSLLEEFGLNEIDENKWSRDKKNFFAKINEISSRGNNIVL